MQECKEIFLRRVNGERLESRTGLSMRFMDQIAREIYSMNKIQIKMNFKPRLIKDIKLTLFKNGRNAREIKREWRPIFVHQMAEFEEAFFGISTRYNQGKESMDIINSLILVRLLKRQISFITNIRRYRR